MKKENLENYKMSNPIASIKPQPIWWNEGNPIPNFFGKKSNYKSKRKK